MAQDEHPSHSTNERQPLLNHQATDSGEGGDSRDLVSFHDGDGENPRQWSIHKKMVNVFIIALMSILSALASSMFTPGIEQIADSLATNKETVIGCTTGFVIMLGIGPLFLAPLSETFGRRVVYWVCFSIFTLLQIPSALSPNIETLIAMRTLSGFFGAVGIANGGGTISDMFEPKERASIFGWYLLGPLLGPTLGPLFGGVIVQRLGWRWIFWVLTIICAVNTAAGFFFLHETYAPVLLQWRKHKLEKDEHAPNKYRFEGEDDRPLRTKLIHSLGRPPRILLQPIVLIMSTYQALIFGTTYSIYTNMQPIYQDDYGFSTEQVGLLYLGPGLGFLFAVWFLVPRIDTVYNRLTQRNGGKSKPEFRLPLCKHWIRADTWLAILVRLDGRNYYIDSFEQYAASAIAAGALFRSLFGGAVPLIAPLMFEKLGYGWGISVFAFISVAIAPAPLVFFYYGGKIRERFSVEL
ncbi:hypothetical protein LTR91_025217 [Friedmanniomyces endolithicus]|uniref:Major facilitator superfamily (MFS) profile domain-containing protein n=1 Tax=Friedmanniomyces endolithicus TaxID=329885 RepID=A0AAN6H0A3_9PEZI|nr:hypothetical protein LTR91_025217 [Friedmanniomyces endolithicus]